jgi:glycosyltransferase involved in cell wall biosynthesis
MNIKFCSCFLDTSGYGQAARDLLKALVDAGVNVTTEIVSFQRSSNLDICPLALKLQNKKILYKKKLIMLTPEHALLHTEPDKYNIEILFWEVLGVDIRWVSYMNMMDEVWTPSQTFADTFVDSGVKVPIFVTMQPTEIKKAEPFKLENFNGFLFYSVFQWTERKNPRMLLKTYWHTFQGKKDVALLLKTYRGNFRSGEKDAIRSDILRWKNEMGIVDFPKVYLVLDEMSSENIVRLNSTGDCFVSAHRGEGWGYPQMEAMSVGKPVISTNFGGIHEHLDNSTAWLIPYDLVNVYGMQHIPWYNERQFWAEPKSQELANAMLEAYDNPEMTKMKGAFAQKLMESNFTYKEVGNMMKERLEKI